MSSLFKNQYAPQTFSIGFVRKPISDVARTANEWLSGLGWTVHETFEAALDVALERMEPTNLRRVLLISTVSEWTAIFNASGDVVSSTRTLSKRCACDGAIVKCREDEAVGKEGVLGSCQLEVFSGVEGSRKFDNERSIAVVNEGSNWKFFEIGPVQPYEDVSMYKQRRVKDRFNVEILLRYCQAIGISPYDEGFYGTDCRLLSEAESLPEGVHAVSRGEQLARIAGTWNAADW